MVMDDGRPTVHRAQGATVDTGDHPRELGL